VNGSANVPRGRQMALSNRRSWERGYRGSNSITLNGSARGVFSLRKEGDAERRVGTRVDYANDIASAEISTRGERGW